MPSKSRLLAFALTALAVAGCRRSAEPERDDLGEASLHAARQPVEIATFVIDEKHDLVAVVRREQLDLRARVRADIADIDRELAALHARGARAAPGAERPADVEARLAPLLERRRQLIDDVARIERADEHGWSELKAQIERDLSTGRRGRS